MKRCIIIFSFLLTFLNAPTCTASAEYPLETPVDTLTTLLVAFIVANKINAPSQILAMFLSATEYVSSVLWRKVWGHGGFEEATEGTSLVTLEFFKKVGNVFQAYLAKSDFDLDCSVIANSNYYIQSQPERSLVLNAEELTDVQQNENEIIAQFLSKDKFLPQRKVDLNELASEMLNLVVNKCINKDRSDLLFLKFYEKYTKTFNADSTFRPFVQFRDWVRFRTKHFGKIDPNSLSIISPIAFVFDMLMVSKSPHFMPSMVALDKEGLPQELRFIIIAVFSHLDCNEEFYIEPEPPNPLMCAIQ